MKKIISLVLVITVVLALVLGPALSKVAIVKAEDPINVAEIQKARLDYIKSKAKVTVNTNLPGKGIPAETDGVKIPDAVKNTALYKSGWVVVSISTDGAPLAEYAVKKGKNTKTIDKNEASNYLSSLKSAHFNVKNVIYSNGIAMRNVKDMYVAYNGFSAEVPVQQLDRLVGILGPSNVHVANLYKIEDQYSNQIVGATNVWTDPGVNGEGVYIGVVDTGVDYTHPDLGGSGPGTQFPTEKIPAGYDFGDNDSDPMDYNGHGTHVSGIIAADGEVKGVAPKAKIVIAKIVSGGEGSAWDTTIAAAFDYMADPENLDNGPEGTHPPVVSVNMSFGADSGFVDPNAPDQKAIENCIANGIVVSLSAGNAYYSYHDYGVYPFFPDYATVGSPAVTPNAIAVAASYNAYGRYPALTELSSHMLVAYTVGSDSPDPVIALGDNSGSGYKYYYCGLGGSLSDFPQEVAGNIALIERGTYTFAVKIHNAAQAGAIGVIIFNSASGGDILLTMATGGETLPSVFIGRTSGLALKAKSMNAGDGSGRVAFYSGTFTDSPLPVDTMVDFSSWGPAPDLSFKPEITAPGGGIWSTVPLSMGGYANYSGTSMASPHVAACAALIKEAHPDWTPDQVKTALMNTADLLIEPKTKLPYSPHLMGAGRVNVYNALHNYVLVKDASNKPYVALGDIPDYNVRPITFTVNVTNNGSAPVTYNVSGTAQTTNFNLTPLSLGNIISFSPSAVKVLPGQTASVNVSIDAKHIKDWTGWPYIEGFVTFTPVSGASVSLHIPYMGFLGNWNDFNAKDWQYNPVIDPPATDPMSFMGYLGYAATWPEFTDGKNWYLTGVDFDGNLDPKSIAFNPSNFFLEADLWLLRNADIVNVSVLKTPGILLKNIDTAYQLYKMYWYFYDPNTGEPWWWDGTDANGISVPDGKYQLQLSATAPKQFDKSTYDTPQNITFDVWVDRVDPVVSVTNMKENGDGTSRIMWLAFDRGPASGIWGYAVLYSADGYKIHWVSPKDNSFDVPSGSRVYVFALDNANNVGYTTVVAP
jgi:lactocepin